MGWTKEDQNRSWRKWYEKNRRKKIDWQARRKQEIHDWVVAQKVSGCTRCSEKDPVCLAFHHPDPSVKEIEIGTALRNSWSREKIAREIAKCVLLCFNCHLKHHWSERQSNAGGG